MEYRQLGCSGLRVSKLCLGTMAGFDKKNEKTATHIIHEAIDLGINFIDTADVYKESEEVVGKALAEGNKRNRVVLATKVGGRMGKGPNDYGASRYHLMKACEDSLQRLCTDRIDLYIIHIVDASTLHEETLRALDTLVRQGKVRYIGTSKHPISRILEGLAVSERYGLERFISEQPLYNLLDRRAENELIPACMRHGIGITPFSPIASGLLSGKYRLGRVVPKTGRFAGFKPNDSGIFTKAALEVVEKLLLIAENKGITLAELSLSWLVHQPGVAAPILGARTAEYLHSGIKACDVKLTPEELVKIDEVVPPGSFVSNYFEAWVYRPLRMAYSSAAQKIPGTGAFIPDYRIETDRKVAFEK